LVVAEAMTYGLPAVVAQGGGASEAVISDVNGFVVSDDAEQMASRILEIGSDPALEDRLRAGAIKSSYEFTVGAMGDRILSVYDHVLQKPLPERRVVSVI
jgi:glycosyltransferase involved in cell wall biosynthesis